MIFREVRPSPKDSNKSLRKVFTNSGSTAKVEKLLTPSASFVVLSRWEISGWNSFRFLRKKRREEVLEEVLEEVF